MSKKRPKSFSSLNENARKELWSCLALVSARGIGPRKSKKLTETFGSAYAAVQAGLESPDKWEGLVPKPAATAFAREEWREEAKRSWQAIQNSDCSLILRGEPDYPRLLNEIPDPPLVLYARGDLGLLNSPAVGIVGSRNCTREGISVTAFFSKGLSKAGVTVVSGMAKGIDRAAHLGGLEGCGSSIAVLGTGIDVVYPSCNHDLMVLLEEKGLVLSEFSPGTPPNQKNFPVRNRIISGLSCGILVIEAARRSGSLITSRLALEQGREVFAVPGHTMAAVSEGCRDLIRKGAKAVFNADDVLIDMAPLLTAQARKNLEERVAQERSRPSSPEPRKRKDDPFLDVLKEAENVSISAGIPLLAPPARKAPAATPKEAPVPAQNACEDSTHSEVPPPGCAICPPDCEKKAAPHNNAKRAKTAPRPSSLGSATKADMEVSLFPSSFLKSLSTDEQALVRALAREETLHIDDLAARSGLEVSLVSTLAVILELRGVLVREPGSIISLNPHLAG